MELFNSFIYLLSHSVGNFFLWLNFVLKTVTQKKKKKIEIIVLCIPKINSFKKKKKIYPYFREVYIKLLSQVLFSENYQKLSWPPPPLPDTQFNYLQRFAKKWTHDEKMPET